MSIFPLRCQINIPAILTPFPITSDDVFEDVLKNAHPLFEKEMGSAPEAVEPSIKFIGSKVFLLHQDKKAIFNNREDVINFRDVTFTKMRKIVEEWRNSGYANVVRLQMGLDLIPHKDDFLRESGDSILVGGQAIAFGFPPDSQSKRDVMFLIEMQLHILPPDLWETVN